MHDIKYGSVCSGIEAATVAWEPLGFRATWFAEIEPFPCAVLRHRYPSTPNLGDMTKLAALVLSSKIAAPDVLVGGTPCQAFSVAGMREGLTDPRGALTIKYVELADAADLIRTRRGEPETVIVWENVPGVLSDKGNAFGCFLGALAGEDSELQPPGKRWQDAGCVYGPKRTIAWRILDAQYFGLAQRRRRVFVVASARNDFDPAAILFEREGVRRDTAPRRGEGQDVTGTAPFGPALQCGCGHVFAEELGPIGCPNCEGEEGPAVLMFGGIPAYGGHSLAGGSVERSATLTAKDVRLDIESETFLIAPSLRAQSNSSHRADSETYIPVCAGTLQSLGKAAGSATGQDAEQGLLVVHGTQDSCISDKAFALGRNSGQENVLLQAVACIHSDALVRTGTAGTPSADAEGRIRLRNPGMGLIEDGTAYNLMATGSPHAVCITGEITHTLKADGFDGSEDGTGRGQPIVAAFAENSRAELRYESGDGSISGALSGGGGKAGQGMPSAQVGSSVRRLTPRECERLQGFPDDYTLIPWPVVTEAPSSPCAKQVVRATVRTAQGRYFVATNHVEHVPGGTCPRRGMPTGQGYELCRDVCGQTNHAEINALNLAGAKAKGGTLFIEGHTYACEQCRQAAEAAGIVEIVIGAPPVGDGCPDGPRYKAIGNSKAVPVVRWIGRRIAQQIQQTR